MPSAQWKKLCVFMTPDGARLLEHAVAFSVSVTVCTAAM